MEKGNYTVYNDAAINTQIERQLKCLTDHLLELFGGDNVEAILLVGGFGRSEGGVFVNGSGVHPVNDYDLLVVVKGSFYLANLTHRGKLKELLKRVAEEIHIKQIDAGITSKTLLRIAPNTIYNYELLAGHQFLWGHINLDKLMPPLCSRNIPLEEGTWLLVNRGGGLLIAARYFSSEGGVPEEKRLNFGIECQKALLAMGDCLLLEKGLYDCSYAKRLERAIRLSRQEESEFLNDYIGVLEAKLRPSRDGLADYDAKDWFSIVDRFEAFYRFYETKRLGEHFEDWSRYADLAGHDKPFQWKEFAKKLYHCDLWQVYDLKNKGTLGEIFIKTLPLLLFSFKEQGIQEDLLDETKKTFLRLPKLKNDLQSLWERQVDQYLSLWHP